MGVWKPTKHASWIFTLVTTTAVLVGLFILFLAIQVGSYVPGTFDIMSRRSEMILLAVFFIISPFIGIFSVLLWAKHGNRHATWLWENGLQGTAKLISCEETGSMLNNAPKIAFELEITLPNRKPYIIQHEEYVGLLYLNRISPGNVFPVFVDPQKPTNILIDWRTPN
ncbi:MAG: hypothetical protein ABH859_03280 [Pseudomonadota bacterium]